jgi:hypothetical protein
MYFRREGAAADVRLRVTSRGYYFFLSFRIMRQKNQPLPPTIMARKIIMPIQLTDSGMGASCISAAYAELSMSRGRMCASNLAINDSYRVTRLFTTTDSILAKPQRQLPVSGENPQPLQPRIAQQPYIRLTRAPGGSAGEQPARRGLLYSHAMFSDFRLP